MKPENKYMEETLGQIERENEHFSMIITHLEYIIEHNEEINSILEEQVKNEVTKPEQCSFIKEMFK